MTEQSESASTNRLIGESSPYLKQHANNPVDWYPWGPEALDLAKAENKPIILSIGYSSCHWCHVMAHESFENKEIASIMNENFVNIKLDREERPDIDQIYMDAVQTMGLRGGWPLNVFLTPDQKPFYGGTYFPPDQWKKLLLNVTEAYETNYDKLYESATQFAQNLQLSEIEKYGLDASYAELAMDDFDLVFQNLSGKFDEKWGGMKKAPKFPMPCLWQFIANYSQITPGAKAENHLLYTLDKIAEGGIYDQIGGGFSRYSVDKEWHVPHFEKMLYDNGQLLSLYANGYAISKRTEYQSVLTGVALWLQREMQHESGGFYSALDADSEGEEGKFYVWTYEEVKDIAGTDFSVIAEYYDVTKSGNWEKGINVLRKAENDETLSGELGFSQSELRNIVEKFNDKALLERSKRIRPGLDNKIISGWNGLALTGLSDAFKVTGDSLFIRMASENASFLKQEMITAQGLLRLKDHNLPAYLEDYAAVIMGFIAYYEISFNEEYLWLAKQLTRDVIANFSDPDTPFFYFTSQKSEELIARKKEIFDNVIPSSNSMMAINLLKLGVIMDDQSLRELAHKMILKINPLLQKDIEYLANWGIASMNIITPTAEVVIIGEKAYEVAQAINRHYLPNVVIMATDRFSDLPLFEHKEPIGYKTTIYVCFNKTCKRPVFDSQSAIREILNR